MLPMLSPLHKMSLIKSSSDLAPTVSGEEIIGSLCEQELATILKLQTLLSKDRLSEETE